MCIGSVDITCTIRKRRFHMFWNVYNRRYILLEQIKETKANIFIVRIGLF